MAHNNHYVVWGTVPGCVGMRSRDIALYLAERGKQRWIVVDNFEILF